MNAQVHDQSNLCEVNLASSLSGLLLGLSDATPSAKPCDLDTDVLNPLVDRLGVAKSLYISLRFKHPNTAKHSLRVAVLCSNWCHRLNLPSQQRDKIEIAALLHDIGKLGVPDRILCKPGRLTSSERAIVDHGPDIGCEILKGCTDDEELINIVRLGSTWFSKSTQSCELPLGSRIIAIVDAFDSMTTDHVYRSAMSHDRAVRELVHGCDTQFDPTLVHDFARMLSDCPEAPNSPVAENWLECSSIRFGNLCSTSEYPPTNGVESRDNSDWRFGNQLLLAMKCGVAFVDHEGIITEWNPALERLTELTAEGVIGRQWVTEEIRLTPLKANERVEACPYQSAIRSKTTVTSGMRLARTGKADYDVEVEVVPINRDIGPVGAIVIIRDLTGRHKLERRLKKLDEKTKLDALTGIGNRAHFDDSLESLAVHASDQGATFGLLICDIDHFKRINDTLGHPAGDEAIRQVARVLRNYCRDSDLVARYGGEEFVVLSDGCDIVSMARRAETIRQAIASLKMPCLNGLSLTVSFGVTEFQSGDSPETVLARGDRALLKAKDNGRNRVVQLGVGKTSEFDPPRKRWGKIRRLLRFRPVENEAVDLVTVVPADMAIEKLKGFIADHGAQISSVSENTVSIKVDVPYRQGRPRFEKRISIRLTLTLCELQPGEMENSKLPTSGCTRINVVVHSLRRIQRNKEARYCTDQLIRSLKSYLMSEADASETVLSYRR